MEQARFAIPGRPVKCSNCEDEGVGRRDLLKLGAAGIVALGLGGPSWQARAAEGATTTLSPGEALAALKSGNERYVSHPELCSIDLAEQRRARHAPGALGDHHQLCQQPCAPRADLWRPRRRRTVRCA